MNEYVPYMHRVRSHRDMDNLVGILRTFSVADKREFLQTHGPQEVTFVHIGAYTGNLEVLNCADMLGLDLFVIDGFRRSALHHAAFKGHVDVLKFLLDRPGGETLLEFENLNGDTALHEAIEGLGYDSSRISRKFNLSNLAAVQLLVDRGANVNSTNTLGYPPLLTAGFVLLLNGGPHAAVWYAKVVKILVSASADVNPDSNFRASGYKPLKCAIKLESIEATRQLVRKGAYIVNSSQSRPSSTMTALHLGAAGRCHEILKILAENVIPSFIDVQNTHGMTPLHCAVQTGHVKNFGTLVDHGASLLATNFEGNTVLQVLFGNREHPVAYLTDGLNTQICLEDDEIVTLNFKALLPPGRLQMEVISALITAVPKMQEMTILHHPLLDAFLRLKWSKFRCFFFVCCIFHAYFLILLFSYAIVLLGTNSDSPLPRRLLLPFASLQLFQNLLAFLIMPRYYVRQAEQWWSTICATMSIAIAVVGEFVPNRIHSDTMDSSVRPAAPWLLNSISVVILFAGIQLMLTIGKFPSSGYYTLMFFTVLKNVAKLFLVFSCLILSFACSFLILFHGEKQFRNSWVTIIKTVVMITGEYDYGDLFAASDKENSMGNTITSIMGGLTFLLFVLIANIVLMNLLTALAVTDVQGLLKKGKLLGLMKQIEFMTQFERMTSHWIYSNCLVPNFLKKMIKREIHTKLSLRRAWFRSHYEQFVYCPRCISENLMKRLFALGEKNRDSDAKSRMESPDEEPEGDRTGTILDLKNRINKLEQRDTSCNPRMQSPLQKTQVNDAGYLIQEIIREINERSANCHDSTSDESSISYEDWSD